MMNTTHSSVATKIYILSSLQLLYWLFFMPSFWKNYTSQFSLSIDKPSPLFRLADINFTDLKELTFRRLLIDSFLILPFVSVCLGMIICIFLNDLDILKLDLSNNLFTVAAGAWGFSFATSIAFAFVSSLAAGIVAAFIFAFAGILVFSDPNSFGYIGVLSLCFATGLVANIILSLTEEKVSFYNVGESLLSLFIGVLFALGSVFIAVFLVGFSEAVAISFFMIIACIIFIISSKFNYLYLLPALFIISIMVSNFYPLLEWFDSLALGLLYGSLLVAYFVLPSVVMRYWLKNADDIQLLTGIGALLGTAATTLVWATIGSLNHTEKMSLQALQEETVYFILLSILFTFLALTFSIWRPIIFTPFVLVWHALIYRLDYWWHEKIKKSSYVRWHIAFWDEHQYANLFKEDLRRHLLWLAEKSTIEVEVILKHLVTKSAWRAIAEEIQAEIEAKSLKEFQSIIKIRSAHTKLKRKLTPSPWLRQFISYSQEIDESFNYTSKHDQIAALNKVAQKINDEIQKAGFGLTSKNANKFHSIAKIWYQIIIEHIKLLQETADKNCEIPCPYLYGHPLKSGNLLFKGRDNDIKQIKSILLNGNSIFLHGQYRIGKTSLLMNLPTFLSNQFIILFVDLQGVVSIAGRDRFFYQFVKQMRKSAQALTPPINMPKIERIDALDAKEYLQEFLDNLRDVLKDKKLVIVCDEFAKLYEAVQDEKKPFYTSEIYNVFRHCMQHHDIQMIISSQFYEGFKTTGELANSMHYLHLGYLSTTEARGLIENPVKNYLLNYEYEAIEYIMFVTRCHPALLQLVCREIVQLKNTQPLVQRFQVTYQDVENILPTCLERGLSIFVTFESKVSKEAKVILHQLANTPEGLLEEDLPFESSTPPEEKKILLSYLRELELIEYNSELEQRRYRFQIELFRRYFEQIF